MKPIAILFALFSLFGLAFAATAALPLEAADFNVDNVHSTVIFKVRHRGVSWFYGRFNEVSGKIHLDDEDPSACAVTIEVPVGSIDSGSGKLDGHLKSADFFDAENHPKIVFESTKVEAGKEENTYKVTGDLTMRDVTKSIEVVVEKLVADGRRGKVAGFHTTFTIDRTDFGVSYGAGGKGVGKEVELTVSIEAGAGGKGR